MMFIFKIVRIIDHLLCRTHPRQADPDSSQRWLVAREFVISAFLLPLLFGISTCSPVIAESLVSSAEDRSTKPTPELKEQEKAAQERQARRDQYKREQDARLAKVEPDFGKVYFLANGEVLRHFPEPLDEELRERWMNAFFGNPDGARKNQAVSLYLEWRDGKAQWKGANVGGEVQTGAPLQTVLQMLRIAFPQFVDADQGLLNRTIVGDWLFDPQAPADKLVPEIEAVLREQWGMPMKLRFRDVDRDVYVVRGDWRFRPISDEFRSVQIYGSYLSKESGNGGGGGDLDQFLFNVGSCINMPVLNEGASPPAKEFAWRFHMKSPTTKGDFASAHDPESVTSNLTSQTGLQFTAARRQVRILFVERDQ